jgi:hypothetical protein
MKHDADKGEVVNGKFLNYFLAEGRKPFRYRGLQTMTIILSSKLVARMQND